MIAPHHLQVIRLRPDELRLVEHFAAQAAIGGTSHVRGDDRAAKLRDDQLVGQAGECALSRYLSGSSLLYALTRTRRNLAPTAGDGGGDLVGTNIDVKCSVMRYSLDPLQYRLLVRPAELHLGTLYVLALVTPDWYTTREITLVGWASWEDLPDRAELEGPFRGAFMLPASALHPLPPFRWTPTSSDPTWTSAGSPTTTSTP